VAWPLIGRDRELGDAGRLLSDAAAGGVVVSGAAGVGKTRLAAEVGRVAAGRGCVVEWVRATRSAGAIPLGAFAPLLPATPAPVEGADVLARARGALADRAGGRRLVLCVDDGHLLDDASAALVHQLVAAGETFAVVTMRRDSSAPDALRALWKDELCALVELEPLSRREVERLLGEALGGPVDGPSRTALWERTRGNALFLRELVRYGVDRGLLAETGGVWRWSGEPAVGTRLADLVGARVSGVGARERGVLEVVAVGAPLDGGVIAPEETAAVESLEAQELVTWRMDGRRRLLDLVHPLHGEVVRAGLARTRREAIERRLADTVEAHGLRRRADLPRVAAWRLDSGAPGDPQLLERAAWEALTARDAGLAERFARAAVDAGGGFGARLVLGRALAGAGRGEESEAVLGELEGRTGDDGERVALAIARARNSFWALDRAADAEAVLRRAEAAVADDRLRRELAGQRVRLVAARGRPLEALEAAMPLLGDANAGEPAQLHAAVAAAEALFSSGRTAEAIAVTETWEPVARRARGTLPVFEVVLRSMRAMALRLAGRLPEATALSERIYELALEQRSLQTAAVEGGMLGYIWLDRGRVRTALRFFGESTGLLRDADAAGMFAWALAGRAQAAAQAGEAAMAREAVAEMDSRPLGHKGFEAELGLGRAWSAAATGELTRARDHARDAARLAQARGLDAYTVRALHELCRLGEPAAVAPELARLAGRLDGPFAASAAAHATALAARDGAALLAAAERFADHGALLVAAEAADAAAAAHHDAGRVASARRAAGRAGVWLGECEGARPPTLLGAAVARELTPREREVAQLAAAGLSSREIADRLVVSVRTVDNHLQRVYLKLGVSRRQDLSRALA
jgi:DNA-binding CsgD family transcriptional regulator